MQIIYMGKFQFFENYRINPDRKWPWEEKDRDVWKKI